MSPKRRSKERNEMIIENFHAKKKKAMVRLIKGKEMATQLQTLLHKPVHDTGVSPEELALQISRSFSETLKELTESTQIPIGDCGGSAASKNKPGVKDRRGCYKRRRTADSWVTVSSTIEDGCAWRKYGQKNIFNSKYPRCYFRCTHKNEGCKAIKQVQRVKGDHPISYQTTYFNKHTCRETLRASNPHDHLIFDSEPEPNLISFQTKSSSPINVSSVKQESTQSNEDPSTEAAKSTLEDPWQDIIELEPLGYKPVMASISMIMNSYQEEVASCFTSYEPTSMHGLDMEVNQLSDLDNFHYFDGIY